MTSRRLSARAAATLATLGLVALAAFVVSCKRTWDNCYDPIVRPICSPTLEVVNCTNPPQPCNTPGYVVAGCSYCSTSAISGCAGSPPPPHCQNAICWQLTARAFGATIARQRAYNPGAVPPAYVTPIGGPIAVERGVKGNVINYTFCTASMTPVVGIPGIPVLVELQGSYDDPDQTPFTVSTQWRP